MIIINYNGWEDTIECLESLDNTLYSGSYDMSLILIDNKSPNDSLEHLIPFMTNKYGKDYVFAKHEEDALDHKVVLFASEDNYGFSGGNNIGIRIAQKRKADYTLLLNNDTTVEGDFVKSMLEIMEKDSNLGIVAPKQTYYYNHTNYTIGGYFSKFKCSGYAYHNSDQADGKYVNYLSGCCWLLRMSAIEKCGLMDESFFMYVEDVEYSCRFVENGYKLLCTSTSEVFHKEGRSTSLKPSLYYYNTRNRLYLSKKMGYSWLMRCSFYSYLLAIRLIGCLKYPEIRPFVVKAVQDYRKGIMGKTDFNINK